MPRASSRSHLLAVGLDALSTDGLSGVTLGRLADAASVSKSGLFSHFRSKEQLQLELLRRSAEAADAVVVAPALAHPPGLARLRALFRGWCGWSARAGLSGGCPVAAALFELDDLQGPVRERVAEMEAHWRGLLRSQVEDAVAAGEVDPATDADQIVWELCGIYLAHHASSRFRRDPASDRRALAAFVALVRRIAPSPDLSEAPPC